MSFRRFFVVRLLWALLGLWIAATLVFVMFYIGVGDPAKRLCRGGRASQASECFELVDEAYHLDSPRYEQYGLFLWRLVADQSTGPSFNTLEEAGVDAREAIPASLSLVVPALLLAAGVGVLAGRTLARVRRRRILDLPIYVAVGLSPIFLGLLLLYYAGFRWDLIPIGGYCDFFSPPQPQAFEPQTEPCGGAVDWATHLVLPVITLSVYFAAIYTRVVRALVLETRSAKEPEERRNRRRRSALLLARLVGRDFGFVLGVAMFVEVLFGIPGLGAGAVASVYADDHIELQAYVLYATFLAVAVHFVVDVVVGALDPGLRWERPVARRPKPA